MELQLLQQLLDVDAQQEEVFFDEQIIVTIDHIDMDNITIDQEQMAVLAVVLAQTAHNQNQEIVAVAVDLAQVVDHLAAPALAVGNDRKQNETHQQQCIN